VIVTFRRDLGHVLAAREHVGTCPWPFPMIELVHVAIVAL
jgi:hypothetical protein